MSPEVLRNHVVDTLDDGKGRDIVALNVMDITNITDFMVIVSGTSNRHVKALVDQVEESTKAQGYPPRGIEGRETYEWVLVDLGDVVVHVMQVETRSFYDLERLWGQLPTGSETSV